MGQDVHSQRPRHARDVRANPAEADQPEDFIPELDAAELFPVPFAAAHAFGRPRDSPHQREHEGNGLLRRRDRVPSGSIQHRDAATCGGIHVHVVHARAGTPDHAEQGSQGQHGLGDLGLGTDEQRMGAREDLGELIRLSRGVGHFELGNGAQDFEAPFVHGVGDGNDVFQDRIRSSRFKRSVRPATVWSPM